MAKTTDVARAVIYCRISDDREGEGLGVARQREDCERRAHRDGWDVVNVYVDNDRGASRHSKKSRPEYAAMLDAVRRGEADVILAYSNSRLTRRPMELEDLITLHEQTGVQLRTMVSGDDDLGTADGRMVARIKASVDAGEAERVSERVRRQVEGKVERGEWLGGPRPFGWGVTVQRTDAEGKVHREHRDMHKVNATEAAMILSGSEHVLDGGSVGQLIRQWNASKVRTVRGSGWTHKTINRVLTRWRNAGVYEYQGEPQPGTRATWEPLPGISEDMVRNVRAVLLDPQRERATGYAPVHPLAGLALCGKCGSKLLSGAISTRKGTILRMYRCSGSGCGLGMKIDDLDAYVAEAVAGYFLLQGRKRPSKDTSVQDAELRAVRRQRAALKAERAAHVQLLNDRILSPSELRPTMARLDAEDARLVERENAILRSQSHETMAHRAANVLRPSKATGRISLAHAAEVHAELVEQWRGLPLERKRDTLRLLFSVTVRPVAEVGSKAPDARVVVTGPEGWSYGREVVGAA